MSGVAQGWLFASSQEVDPKDAMVVNKDCPGQDDWNNDQSKAKANCTGLMRREKGIASNARVIVNRGECAAYNREIPS